MGNRTVLAQTRCSRPSDVRLAPPTRITGWLVVAYRHACRLDPPLSPASPASIDPVQMLVQPPLRAHALMVWIVQRFE